MKFHGVQIQEGSSISNLTVASGTAFPGTPNEAEMFYRTDSDIRVRGLYAYIGGNWDRIASADAVTVPSAANFPSVANTGDLFYKDSNDVNEALYVYTGSVWVPAASGSGSTAMVTGDVTGTLTVGGTGALTLASIVGAATVGSASTSTIITNDAKGRITGSSTTPIAVDATQVITGSFSDARVAQSNVTQHQGALSLAASQTTSGTFADARIAASNVTQHQAALTILETQITNGALLTRVADNETITGTWAFNNALSVGTPSSSSHATTKAYVDAAINGLSWKNPVIAATTANITLSGAQTIDSVAVVAGQRVLVKNQSTQSQNGVYVVAAGVWTRSADFDQVTPVDEVNSAAVFVQSGTLQADSAWTQTAPVVSIGSDAMVFSQFATGGLIGGAGLTITGNLLDVGTASASRIVVNADNIDLATVTNSGTGTLQKLTTDSYGRVTGTTAVTAADVIGLVDTTYVNVTGDTVTGGLQLGSSTTYTSLASSLVVNYPGSGTQYGILLKPATSNSITNAISFLTSTSTAGAPTLLGAIQHLGADAGLNLTGTWSVNNSAIATAASVAASYVAKAGDTMTGALSISYANSILQISTPSSTQSANIYLATAGSNRWRFGKDTTAEAGSNAGSNFFFIALADDGATQLGTALSIVRSTLAANFGGPVAAPTFTGALTGAASLNVLKTGDTMTGNLVLNNAVYLSSKTSGGTSTRILGINNLNDVYIGSIDTATGGSTLFVNGSERMRIDSAGAVRIGSSSSFGYSEKLSVVGGITHSGTQLNVLSGTSTNYEFVNRSATAGFDFYVNAGSLKAMTINSAGVIQDSAGNELGLKNIPPVTNTFVRGQCNVITAGTTVGASNAGDTYSVYNNSAVSVTLTQGAITMFLGGTNASGNRTLLPRGLATIWFLNSTTCVINGNVT